MAERAKLGAFDVNLRRGTRIRWPAGGTLGCDERIDTLLGTGDLLDLRHAPSRRFLGGEPIHENLMIELLYPLAGSRPGVLRFGRVVYRAGSERLVYQATDAVGTVMLVEATPARCVIEVQLTLINPEIDVERTGSYALAGRIVVDVALPPEQ